MLGPTLETERLVLRVPSAEDFEPYAAFMADAEASAFLGGPIPASVTWRNLASLIGAWVMDGFSMFTFVERKSGRWVGRGGPWSPHGWPGTEVGWAIAPEFQRRGFAKEAAIACIDWAFEELGWETVIHCIDPRNAASIALARSLGSTLQRTQVAAPAPIVASWDIYGQTRAAWRAWRSAKADK